MKIFRLLYQIINVRFLVTAILTAGCVSVSLGLEASAYATGSRLASGHWTRVSTDTAGIYEIGYDRLRQWGYTNPAAVRVYGVGPLSLLDDNLSASCPDDICPTLTINDPGREKIYFYSPGTVSVKMTSPGVDGVTVVRTPYTSRASFLLSDIGDNGGGNEPAPVDAPSPAARPTDAHYSVGLVEYEYQNPADGGAILLGPDIKQDNEVFFTFRFKNMGSGTTPWKTAYMKVNYAGVDAGAQTRATLDLAGHLVAGDVKITTTAIPIVYDETVAFRHGSVQMSWSKVLDGDLTFGVKAYGKSDPRFLAFDNAWTIYPRLSKMGKDDAMLDMYYPGVFAGNAFSLDAPSATKVLNVTDPNRVFEHKLIGSSTVEGRLLGSFDRSYSLSVDNPDAVCRLIAFNPDVPQRQIRFEGEAANSNLHGQPTPDMLIITTSAMRPAADELASIHAATDGLECLVVDHESVFNEFSYANPDAMAYRRLAKMFYDRDPKKFRYILLYGPGHWDNRGILTERPHMLLTYQVKNPLYAGNTTRNYNADAFFGMLNDENHNAGIQATPLKVAVGRIPAPTLNAARAVNKKIERVLTQNRPARLFSNALVMSDDGDRNIHFTQSEELIGILKKHHSPITIVRAHNLIYPWEGSDAKMARRLTINTLIDGVGLMTYTGHGHPNGFSGEQLWSRSAVQSFDTEYPPFIFLSTCDPMAFDRDEEGIGVTMLLKDNGGGLGVIGACRTVYSPQNQELMVKLTEAYADASPSATIGDVWLAGREKTLTSLTASIATQFNTMCYNLCGDPSLPVGAPDYHVTTDKIDGETPDGETIELSARTPVELSGRITADHGETVGSFTGTVTINVYETPVEISTIPRNPADDPVLTTVLDHKLLASKTVEVADGIFKTRLYLPYPTTESDRFTTRIVMVADGADNTKAVGVLDGVSVKATRPDNEKPSPMSPTVTDIAIDSFTGGMKPVISTGTPHTLLARGTTDGTGINASTAIGLSPAITIDPESDNPTVIHPHPTGFVSDGDDWTLKCGLPELTPGHHDARLTIVDNAGNRAYETIGFTVVDKCPYELKTTDGGHTLASDRELTFDLLDVSTGQPATAADSRVIVRDRGGKAAFVVNSPSFPLTLRLSDTRLDMGRYEIYVIGYADNMPFATPALPLTVIRTSATQ